MPDEEIIVTEDPTPEPTPEPTPVARTMLDDVKLALRITTDAFDYELSDLIVGALMDLGVAGVLNPVEETDEDESGLDPLMKRAVITYCKMHFGQPDDYDRLKKSYDEQKAQLSTCTGYTVWTGLTS